MKWNEHPDQKLLVFCFQWKGKPVDDGPKDLKKLPNSVEVFRFVDEPTSGVSTYTRIMFHLFTHFKVLRHTFQK